MKQSLILILIITIISACILIFSFRAAHPFTFEGELDPNEFVEWPPARKAYGSESEPGTEQTWNRYH